MAKRFGDFNQGYSKKQKIDSDNLWGDNDLDDQGLDIFLDMCERETACTQRNTSIVPTYTAFKQQTKRVFTSTQSNPELNTSISNPSTSKNNFRVTNGINHNQTNNFPSLRDNGFKRTYCYENNNTPLDLESKLRKVETEYKTKEGEVSFLRSQLKDIRFQNDKEHVKKEKEWSEKFSTVTKQLNAVKTELEFKNLEVTKLKDTVKTVNRDPTFCTQSSFFKQPKNGDRITHTQLQPLNDSINTAATSYKILRRNEDIKIYNTVENYYPLQHCIEASLFYIPSEEEYSSDIKSVRIYGDPMSFLQTRISQEVTDRFIEMQPKRTVLPNGKDLNIDYIHSDMFNLMKLTSQELEIRENYTYINKIVCTSEQLCDNLYKILLEFEKGSVIIGKSQKDDMLYLKTNSNTINSNISLFSPEDWLYGEMGKSARQSIACLSHILQYSSYLRQYLLENKRLIFTEGEDYLDYLPIARLKFRNEYLNNYHYLKLLFSIVNVSGKLRNSHNFSGFLSAVCLLLNKIYLCSSIEDLCPLITRLTRELVFVCPNIHVLCYLSELFKNAALHSVFVMDLCNMTPKGGLKVDPVEKIIYYKQDVCVLQMFCALVECNSSNVKSEKVLELYSTVMMFIKNCFKVKLKWTHYQEDKHCDCLCKIVKLGVDILYQVSEEFKKSYSMNADTRKDGCHSDEYSSFIDLLRNGIEVLQIFKYKVYDIIVKYFILCSQYKVIIKSLIAFKEALNLTETHVERLQDLLDVEEISIIETGASCGSLWD